MFSSPNLALTCALWVLATSVSCLQPSDKETRYRKCKKGDGIYTGNVVATLINKPRMRCYEACSLDDRCRSLNVCPSERPAGYHCDLMDDVHPLGCHDLTTDSHLDCVYQVKVSKCGTGKERPDGTCRCDVCYKGATCQEHVRDCLEASDVLPSDSDFKFTSNKKCLIRPTSAARPFLVQCLFTTSKETSVLRRLHFTPNVIWESQKWDDFKDGMGSFDSNDYFIGLENLHHFLAQAPYLLNLFNQFTWDSNSPLLNCTKLFSYRNLTIGDESHRYSLSYDIYSNVGNESDKDIEFFSGTKVSHKFCTPDRDCSGPCAENTGPGWYPSPVGTNGVACEAFFGSPALWPCPGQGMVPLIQADGSMERVGDFY